MFFLNFISLICLSIGIYEAKFNDNLIPERNYKVLPVYWTDSAQVTGLSLISVFYKRIFGHGL